MIGWLLLLFTPILSGMTILIPHQESSTTHFSRKLNDAFFTKRAAGRGSIYIYQLRQRASWVCQAPPCYGSLKD